MPVRSLRAAALGLLLTLLVLGTTPAAGAAPASAGQPGGPTSVLYVVLPHPDDEFEVWSQVQDTIDREGQARLFHVRQHFRVSFGPPPSPSFSAAPTSSP